MPAQTLRDSPSSGSSAGPSLTLTLNRSSGRRRTRVAASSLRALRPHLGPAAGHQVLGQYVEGGRLGARPPAPRPAPRTTALR